MSKWINENLNKLTLLIFLIAVCLLVIGWIFAIEILFMFGATIIFTLSIIWSEISR
jgi:hypothetical protein